MQDLSRIPVVADSTATTPPVGFWTLVLRRLLKEKTTVIPFVVLTVIVLASVFAPVIAPHDAYEAVMLNRLKPIGTTGFPLGTDELGRDMFSRLLYGGRLSLFMAAAPVLLAVLIGSAFGLIAGYYGGRVNSVVMRAMDVLFAFPSVLLAVAIAGALGAGVTNALVSLTVVFIPSIARVAESATTQIRSLPYIDAARISGANTSRIIRVHLLGNVLGPVFVYAMSLMSVSIILSSGLSFLGLGVKPPTAEWGVMLNTLRSAIYIQPNVAILPGALIFLTSICCNLVADGMRAAMDLKA